MSLQLSADALKVFTLATNWAQYCETHPLPESTDVFGGDTSESALIMQLTDPTIPENQSLNRFAPYYKLGPKLTPAGKELYARFDKWAHTFARLKPVAAVPAVTPEAWLQARQTYLPPRFSLKSPWAQEMPVHVLLWLALCQQSPMAGLYMPVSKPFLASLRLHMHLPNPPRASGPSNMGTVDPFSGLRMFMYR